MAVTSKSFARLRCENQFRPGENVKFILEYSENLAPIQATLQIDLGYGLFVPVYTQSQYANTAIEGVWFEEFVVPAYGLGLEPDEVNFVSMPAGQGATAKVLLGDTATYGTDNRYNYELAKLNECASKYRDHHESPEWQAMMEDAIANATNLPIPAEEHEKQEAIIMAINAYRANPSWRTAANIGVAYANGLMACTFNVTDETKVFESNTIQVPVYVASKYPIAWLDNYGEPPYETTITSSVFDKKVWYYRVYSTPASEKFDYINSYRGVLYDSHNKIVKDTGIKHDWILTTSPNHSIRFRGLKDGQTYTAKVFGSTVGGYHIESQPLTVHVDIQPFEPSPYVTLTNAPAKGSVKIETHIPASYSAISIYRSIEGADEWMLVSRIVTSDDVTIYDPGAVAGIPYTYKVVADNTSYYASIIHKFNGVCIWDRYGCYCAEVNVTKYAIDKNARTVFQTTVGSKYPYAIIPSVADYHESGSTSGSFFDTEDDCQIKQEEIQEGNASYSHAMLDWLNNGQAKMLKYDDGFAAIVAIDGSPSISQDENELYINNFGWKEIANWENLEDWITCGLIEEEE